MKQGESNLVSPVESIRSRDRLPYSPKITPEHLARKAIVYLRQSGEKQVSQNTESQRLQFNTIWPSEYVGWVGRKSKSLTAISAPVQRLAPLIGRDLSASSALLPEARWGSSLAAKSHGFPVPTRIGAGLSKSAGFLEPSSETNNRFTI